jgi:hypothetical protein
MKWPAISKSLINTDPEGCRRLIPRWILRELAVKMEGGWNWLRIVLSDWLFFLLAVLYLQFH